MHRYTIRSSSGGEDPESRDQARRNAPLTVKTLDRIVSLTDFEDFARAFSGIGRQAGITDDQIAALESYAESDLFSPLDRLVLQYTDAVTNLDDNAPALAAKLRAELSEQELVELTFCIANWNLMAHLLMPLEIELEPAAQEFLPDGWER